MKNSFIALLLLPWFVYSQPSARQATLSSSNESPVLTEIKKSYERQIGAAFTMLEHAMDNASDTTWTARLSNVPFWQICYHVLWFTDYYFHADQATFKPQSFDMEGIHNYWVKPDSQMKENQKHPISRRNMKAYSKYVRQKAHQFIQNITVAYFTTPSPFEWHGFPKIDLVDYNLRHLQHHVGQLDIVIRRDQNTGNPWIMFDDLVETPKK